MMSQMTRRIVPIRIAFSGGVRCGWLWCAGRWRLGPRATRLLPALRLPGQCLKGHSPGPERPRDRRVAGHAAGALPTRSASGWCGEVVEAVPESAVVPEGDAQFLGSCVIGLPAGLYGVLPFREGLDEFLDAAIHQTRGALDRGARVVDEHGLDLVPGPGCACGGLGGW